MTSPSPESYPAFKVCSSDKCMAVGVSQPISNFFRDKRYGYTSRCKTCRTAAHRAWYDLNHEYVLESARMARERRKDAAKIVRQRYVKTHRAEVEETKRKWRERNPETVARYGRTYREKSWAKKSTTECFRRAKKKGVPFGMIYTDLLDSRTGALPTHCPIFPHIALDYRAGVRTEDRRCWPSVDRIVPNLGYVSGNVWVISFSANTWKYNGSNADEHRRIVEIMTGRSGPIPPVDDWSLESFPILPYS